MNVSEKFTNTLTLAITGMGCKSCVNKIETALNSQENIASAVIDFDAKVVNITGSANAESVI